MESLKVLQGMSVEALTALSLETGNRQYSLCLTAILGAMEAHAMGDMVMVRAYAERAKLAHTRAQEDEKGLEMRARATMKAVEEKGLTAQGVETIGKNVFKVRMQPKAATWLPSWARFAR